MGVRPVDYRAERAAMAEVFGQTWTLESCPRGMRVEVVADDAEVLARDQDGLPVALANRAGAGVVACALPRVEASIAAVAGDRTARDHWLA